MTEKKALFLLHHLDSEARQKVVITIIAVALGTLCWAVFGGNDSHQFLRWDDRTYVTANPWITHPSFEHMMEIWTDFRLAIWHPVTWMSYIPEYQLAGERAWVFKLSNIALHAINSMLVFFLCRQLLLSRGKYSVRAINTGAVFTACLFAVHPGHVESVIWISGRKDLLCFLFYVLAVLTYLRNDNRVSGFTIFWFSLALLSKSMAVSLPFVLLVLDWYRSDLPIRSFVAGPLGNSVRKQLALLTMSAAVIAITILSQINEVTDQPPWGFRLLTAVEGLKHYLLSLFYYADLSPFYPAGLVNNEWSASKIVTLAIAATIPVAVIATFKRAGVAALLTVVITLIPVLGIVSVGEHAYADRYAYLPMVALYVLLGGAITRLSQRNPRWFKGIAVVFLCLLFVMARESHMYKEVWANDLRLWTFVAQQHSGNSALVHKNFGNALFEAGHSDEALEQLRIAQNLAPEDVRIYRNMSVVFLKEELFQQAVGVLEEGMVSNPQSGELRVYLGDLRLQHGELELALDAYEDAIGVDPDAAVPKLRAAYV